MRIACVATNDYEDSEFDEPVAALRRAGHDIDVIAPTREPIAGKRGRSRVDPDLTIDEAHASEYDALFVPGGFSPDHLRGDDRFLSFVQAFDAANKPIYAICHGPQLLLAAGILDGRVLTAWRTVQDDLRRADIRVKDAEVVIDGNLVTSRQPSDLPAFCRTIVEHLEDWSARPSIAHAVEERPTLH